MDKLNDTLAAGQANELVALNKSMVKAEKMCLQDEIALFFHKDLTMICRL